MTTGVPTRTSGRRISQFIVENDLDNVVMLAGDAHMIAADDGSHSNYSGLPGSSFPVLQAAPIDQQTSIKGGPYSEGYRGRARTVRLGQGPTMTGTASSSPSRVGTRQVRPY